MIGPRLGSRVFGNYCGNNHDRAYRRENTFTDRGRASPGSLARARIHRSVPVRVDLEDLIAYGELGLAQAARDFDPSRDCRFVTFAYYRVQGAIYDGLAKMTWTSRSRYKRLRYQQLANDVLDQETATN